MIRTTLVLESTTSPKNFAGGSMSFYDFVSIDAMSFVMPHTDLVLVHINQETGERRSMVVNGAKFFNSLEYRSFNKRRVIVYRY